jgi:uncharacterized protein (TIGR02594 family)
VNWLSVALRESGVAQLPPGQSNARIEEYHRTLSDKNWDDKVPWCSSFLNWCMLQSGLPGTNSALARSWLHWGIPLAKPRTGCVVILWRKNPESPKGHAGLFLHQDAELVYLWGGNQLGKVCANSYPVATILGYRWPASTAGGDVLQPVDVS